MSAHPEIDSRFDVLAKLGEGGMGCVYKVRHRALNEIQIVKTLQARFSGDDALRRRFVNEARRGMRLHHPHIAAVHDFQVCADGTGYIVMEYVAGHNLRDLLATRGALPLQLVGAIAVQALSALAYLHDEKFIHRDISPDNLMLTTDPDGRPVVKLIDLGISKSLEAGQTVTGTGQFLGKVSYASPEQFGGHPDGRSDLYSLGVVLYKLLTNTEPFTGKDYREIITAHLFHPPRPLEETGAGRQIPKAVQRVIWRALEKEPDQRYRDAREFLAAVEEAFDLRGAAPAGAVLRAAKLEFDALAQTQPDRTPATEQATAIPLSDETEVSQPRNAVAAPTEAEIPFVEAPTILDPLVVDRPAVGRPAALFSRRIWNRAALVVLAGLLIAAAAVLWQQREAARLAAYGKFYAVVIAESRYRMYPELRTAVADGRAVARLLETRYGYDVVRLENAGREEILAALRTTAARMTDRDNLLLYYAGHGELKMEKGYWLPVDADLERTNWISPADISDVLLDHPARRTLIIADSCYSGALARGELTPPAPRDRVERRSRLVISSGGNAPVIDSADGRHSIFTRALLDVLEQPGRKVMNVESVFTPIRDRVIDAARRAGREQKPELAVMAEVGDEGGSFFFVEKR